MTSRIIAQPTIRLFAALLWLALAACATPARPQPARAQTQTTSPAASPLLRTSPHRATALSIMRRANEVRREQGLNALVEDIALTNAAQLYAEELARLQRLEHISPTRGLETMTQRIEAAGGAWRRAAENLATTYGVAEMAHTVIDMWLRSPGHRQNLLDTSFLTTGAGVARDSRGSWYFVQLYVLPPARR